MIKKTLILLLAMAVLVAALAGCASSAGMGTTESKTAPEMESTAKGAETDAAGTETAEVPDDGAKKETKFMSYASFNTGSFQYMYAAALAGELLKNHPEYNITAEATSGTSENLDLLYRDEVVFSAASPERLYTAYNGTGNYEEMGKLNVGIMWSYINQASLLFVKADSGIDGFEDLAGKNVCIGAAGSSNETKNSYILDAYGYTRASEDVYVFDELNTFSIDYSEGANGLADGTVDAIIATQPIPETAIYELSLTTDIKVIPVDEKKFEDVRAKYAWMWDTSVPAGTYAGQDEALTTLGDPNYVTASLDSLSEEDAYNITKAYVEEILPVLAEQFDVVRPYAEDNSLLCTGWVVPGHPGAVKYFTERGFSCDVVEP